MRAREVTPEKGKNRKLRITKLCTEIDSHMRAREVTPEKEAK
jgi:hypothetical protein